MFGWQERESLEKQHRPWGKAMPRTGELVLPRPQGEPGYENPGGRGRQSFPSQPRAGRGTDTTARLPSQLSAPVGDGTRAHACQLCNSNRRADPCPAGACGRRAGSTRHRAAQREPPADAHTCPQRWQGGCCHPCSHPLLSTRGELEKGTMAAAELRAAASPHGAGTVSDGRAAEDIEPELHRRTQGHSSPLTTACARHVWQQLPLSPSNARWYQVPCCPPQQALHPHLQGWQQSSALLPSQVQTQILPAG